ncbi:MAG: type II toxin-antitoxin system HicB family antitoxin [Methylophilaceae bacterium]
MCYMVVIEKGEVSYGAFVPDLPGCVVVGETEKEVVDLIQEAIQFHLEDLQTEGQPIPQPASKSTFIEVALAA